MGRQLRWLLRMVLGSHVRGGQLRASLLKGLGHIMYIIIILQESLKNI